MKTDLIHLLPDYKVESRTWCYLVVASRSKYLILVLSVMTDRVLMRVSWNVDDTARQEGLFGFRLFFRSVSVQGSYRLSTFYVPIWRLDLVYVVGM